MVDSSARGSGSNSCFELHMGSGPDHRRELRAIWRVLGRHTAEDVPHFLALDRPPPPFTAEETEAGAAS